MRRSFTPTLALVLALALALVALLLLAARVAALPYESQRWLDEQEWANANLKGLQGRVLIDGEEYEPVCSCSVPPPEHSQECYPRAVKITRKPDLPGALAPGRLVLDGANLRRLVGDPADLRMADASKHYFSDIDGRSSEEALRVWGGEAGELLLALAVWEDMTIDDTGAPLRYTSVKKAVHDWVRFYDAPSKRKAFYIHTDTDAMAFVEQGVKEEMGGAGDSDSSGGSVSTDDDPSNVDVTMPAPHLQDTVLERLLQPQGNGCPHLKQIMLRPAAYEIREELVQMFLTHVYRMMWDTTEPLRTRMKVYVYHAPDMGGLPHEAAWVDFVVGDTCLEEHKAPLFPAWSDGVSILVNHPQAVDKLHNDTALFIKGMTGGTANSMEILPKLKAKYALWDSLTKGMLPSTQGLPRYEVELSTIQSKTRGTPPPKPSPKSFKDVDPKMYEVGPLDGEE
jgi:hypothetical protein